MHVRAGNYYDVGVKSTQDSPSLTLVRALKGQCPCHSPYIRMRNFLMDGRIWLLLLSYNTRSESQHTAVLDSSISSAALLSADDLQDNSESIRISLQTSLRMSYSDLPGEVSMLFLTKQT